MIWKTDDIEQILRHADDLSAGNHIARVETQFTKEALETIKDDSPVSVSFPIRIKSSLATFEGALSKALTGEIQRNDLDGHHLFGPMDYLIGLNPRDNNSKEAREAVRTALSACEEIHSYETIMSRSRNGTT